MGWEKTLSWIDKRLPLLLLAILLMRGGFLLVNGLDLIGDESYYWDWSRQPDWCYYSKPPMVAWLIGLSTWLFGDYTMAVRLPALLLGTLFLFYFHATAKAFYGARAAAMALLLMLAAPINVLANFLMTIDSPLYCFWIMSLYYLRRALFDADAKAWLWAGCASAAALLSKQAALALPAMLLGFLLLDRSRRIYLRREYWLYLLPVVLATMPILWWNQQHDWVMFGHSKGHFGNHQPVTLGKHLQWARDFLFYQLLLMSPLSFFLVLVTAGKGLQSFRQLSAEQRFLWLMGPALLLVVLLLSLLQKAQGNWPMPFYLSGLILLAGLWAQGQWRKTMKWAIGVGGVLVASTYVLPLLLALLNLQNTHWDPTKRFKNWQTVAADVQTIRDAHGDELDGAFVVALGHRYLASQLAFNLQDHPRVYRFETSGRVTSQYEVWPGPQALIGHNALIVGETPPEKIPAELRLAFAEFELLGQVTNPGNAKRPYFIYQAKRLISWPL